MIIELFGPPGVGKTTFAHALTARLREHGHVVEPMLSHRPSEASPHLDVSAKDAACRQSAAALRRVTRAVGEMLATAGHLFANSHERATAANLIRILPPKNIVWSIKSHQYLLRLCRSWHLVSAANDIALFDQGFVQAVCTLALLGGAGDGQLIARALDSIPKPDLLIRLDAPREILAARLRERQRRQGKIEQLLEFDSVTNLEAIQVIEQLHHLVQKRGYSVTCVSSVDRRSLVEAVERTEREVVAKFSTSSAGRHDGGGPNLRHDRGTGPYASVVSLQPPAG